MKVIKILGLFAGTQSDEKALSKIINIDYKGVDIYSPEGENIILDLTQNNIIEKLKEKLGDWKPDFIWASPVCNKFSRVITGKGGNFYFQKFGNDIYPRNNWDIKVQPHMKNKCRVEAKSEAIGAMKMYDNTKEIINYFNVPFAIENPSTALSQYILKEYIKNDCNYCRYGFTYKKPTSIYTNKKLELLKCNHKGKHPDNLNNTISKYADRSRVPEKLIQDIFKQLMEVN